MRNFLRSADDGNNRAITFVFIFTGIFLLHVFLLRLPYFWDEAGYYVPAARDLLFTGSLIPHSTPSNAHPPLVMAYLASCWKIAGFTPLVTRTSMLGVAAFALTGIFFLARRVASVEVAIASTVCTAIYPVFFTQSSLAQVDLAAAGLTFWGLLAYVEDRSIATAAWFSLAVLAKETAVLAPASLLLWELLRPYIAGIPRRPLRRALMLMFPIVPLATWYGYHYRRTGFIFGNPEFFRYNVQATIVPLRIFLTFVMRFWQCTGYLSLYVLTLTAVLSMWLHPLRDGEVERKRIAPDVQFAFLAIIVGYTVALSIVGGAVLARYMLPVVPLVVIVCVSTIRRRVPMWHAVIGIVVITFIGALFFNPPYGFSLEDNLAYRDYIELHRRAESFMESRYANARVLTAWPASDEVSRPFVGYVERPLKVFRVEDFTVEELVSAGELRSQFDVALVFSTKYVPPRSVFDRLRWWQECKARFFGFHQDESPGSASHILGGKLVYSDRRSGQWVGVIEMEPVVDAREASGP